MTAHNTPPPAATIKMQTAIHMQEQHKGEERERERGQQENTHRKCRTRTVSAIAMWLLLLGALLAPQARGVRAEEESQDFQKNSKYQAHTHTDTRTRLKLKLQSKPLQIMLFRLPKRRYRNNLWHIPDKLELCKTAAIR